MAKVAWTDEAERWLLKIHDYIALDSPANAFNVVKAIDEAPVFGRHRGRADVKEVAMSIATAYLMLVPREPAYVPPPGTAREVARRLHTQGAFFLSEFTEDPPVPPPELVDDEATRFRLHPRDPHVPIARFHTDYTPFSLAVEEFPKPTAAVDDVGLRCCNACGALVDTMAVCAACGVEEDPSEWRLGRPKVIYTRALELGIVADGGLDIWAQSDPHVEGALRDYFGKIVPELERTLGIELRLVRLVGP